MLAALAVFAFGGCRKADDAKGDVFVPRAKGTVTFNQDIAPIVFNNCSGCHHPGGSAPFDLLAYDDVKKRAKHIVEVTQRRVMPPWLPDPKLIHFVGERQLTAQQIGLVKQWAEEGATEGKPQDLPPAPKWNPAGRDWQLGEPDLVVKPTVAFSLAAEGRDVYRNLIVPLGGAARRHVRAMEFRPNSRAVHHAFLRFDKTSNCRARAGQDGQPGFYGLHTPSSAESPITFASWQPGKTPRFNADDLVWPLEPGTDLILQLHLQPTGKVEPIAPEVAFYFTDKPGTAIAFKLPLNSYTIDIPAGATNYLASDTFVLPIDVEVRGVLPHAHYLCRQMRGWAELPDGSRRWLMAINEWDFNWQGDYQFPAPVALPKGAKIVMEYSFDNSTNNAHNPSVPPRPVLYGMNTTDEMAELWLLVAMKSQQDHSSLMRALQPRFIRDSILSNEALLRRNPNDARAYCEIGSAYVMAGKPDEGLVRLRQSIQLEPNYDESHYFSGLALRYKKDLAAAQLEFEAALRINPKHARACGNLALVLMEQGNYAAAMPQFEMALQLNPQDEIARGMLQRLRQSMQKPK